MFSIIMYLKNITMHFVSGLINVVNHEVSALFSTLKKEILRTLLLTLIGFWFLKPDTATQAMISYSFGLSLLLVAASHICAKILFRSVNPTEYAQKALHSNSVSAALIFMAYCLVLISLMYFFTQPLLK